MTDSHQDLQKEHRKLTLKHAREIKKLTEELSVYKKKLQEADLSAIEGQNLEVGCNEEVVSTDDNVMFDVEDDYDVTEKVSFLKKFNKRFFLQFKFLCFYFR